MFLALARPVLLKKIIDCNRYNFENNGPSQGFLASSVDGTVEATRNWLLNRKTAYAFRCLLKRGFVRTSTCRTQFARDSISKIGCRAPKAAQARQGTTPDHLYISRHQFLRSVPRRRVYRLQHTDAEFSKNLIMVNR